MEPKTLSHLHTADDYYDYEKFFYGRNILEAYQGLYAINRIVLTLFGGLNLIQVLKNGSEMNGNE